MKSNDSKAGKQVSIPCIEVLISRSAISKNLHWTLSIYSLENNPVNRYPAIHNCDVFHFMNFDWIRTIRHLLEEHQIPYTIIQYFSSDTIHAGVSSSRPPVDESAILSALDQMEACYPGDRHSLSDSLSSLSAPQYANRILAEKDA